MKNVLHYHERTMTMAKEHERSQLEMMIDGSKCLTVATLITNALMRMTEDGYFFLSGVAFNNILLFITKGVKLKIQTLFMQH